MAVVQYTFTYKQYTEQQNLVRARAVPRLCELYSGICHTTEEKARKNLSNNRKIQRNLPITEEQVTEIF